MTFSVEIMFLGLMLFCQSDDTSICGQPGRSVLLINTKTPPELCGERLVGNHEPVLVVDESDKPEWRNGVSSESWRCHDGRKLQIVHLMGKDVCFDFKGGNRRVHLVGGRDVGRERPDWALTNVQSYGWIGHLPSMDRRVRGLREEALQPATDSEGHQNSYVAARIHIGSGLFESAALGREDDRTGIFSKWVVWSLAKKVSQAGSYQRLSPVEIPLSGFPRVMAGRPRLTIRDVGGSFVVKDCDDEGSYIVRFINNPGILRLRIANDVLDDGTNHRESVYCGDDPPVQLVRDGIVHHYLWQYWLTMVKRGNQMIPWPSDWNGCQDLGGGPNLPILPEDLVDRLTKAPGTVWKGPPYALGPGITPQRRATTTDPYCPPADFP